MFHILPAFTPTSTHPGALIRQKMVLIISIALIGNDYSDHHLTPKLTAHMTPDGVIYQTRIFSFITNIRMLAHCLLKDIHRCVLLRTLQWIFQQPVMTEPCFNFSTERNVLFNKRLSLYAAGLHHRFNSTVKRVWRSPLLGYHIPNLTNYPTFLGDLYRDICP